MHNTHTHTHDTHTRKSIRLVRLEGGLRGEGRNRFWEGTETPPRPPPLVERLEAK
jgi:hypothetical protein